MPSSPRSVNSKFSFMFQTEQWSQEQQSLHGRRHCHHSERDMYKRECSLHTSNIKYNSCLANSFERTFIMRYQIIAAFALFTGLVAALPKDAATDARVVRRDYNYTTPPEAECVKCPPEPEICNNCTKGCIYIECDDCDKEDCCKCLGLEKKKPYVYEPQIGLTYIVSLLSYSVLRRAKYPSQPFSWHRGSFLRLLPQWIFLWLQHPEKHTSILAARLLWVEPRPGPHICGKIWCW